MRVMDGKPELMAGTQGLTGVRRAVVRAAFIALAFALLPSALLAAQNAAQPVDDMTANYHFISPDDTLAVLDEEGRLKGYIDVVQGPDESDDVLSYDLVDGIRKAAQVTFRTNRIHGRFYRFSGTVERGTGQNQKDSDYLRLVGSLEVVKVNSDTGAESVQTQKVTLKSIGKAERPADQ